MQELAVTMEYVLKQNKEGLLRNPTTRTTIEPDVKQSLPELLNHLYCGSSIRNIAQAEVRRIYAFELNKSLIKAAEDALSYAF